MTILEISFPRFNSKESNLSATTLTSELSVQLENYRYVHRLYSNERTFIISPQITSVKLTKFKQTTAINSASIFFNPFSFNPSSPEYLDSEIYCRQMLIFPCLIHHSSNLLTFFLTRTVRLALWLLPSWCLTGQFDFFVGLVNMMGWRCRTWSIYSSEYTKYCILY